MTIIKSRHAGNYTVVPNEILKSGLSLDSIGLLIFLLSKPHDWVLYKNQIASELNIGKDKMQRMFSELNEKGYVISTREINKDGTFKYNHIVYDISFNGEPYAGFPPTDKPPTDNPPLLSKDILSKDILNKVLTDFELWWSLYDKKVGKEKALSKWKKLKPIEQQRAIEKTPKYIEVTPDKKYRKDPTTYLNGKHWEDELIETSKSGIYEDKYKLAIEIAKQYDGKQDS